MIHLENVHKTYYNGTPLHVLKGINLHIDKENSFPSWVLPVPESLPF